MKKILVIDDHSLVRRGIVRVLAGEFPDLLTGEASHEAEALAALWSGTWDLVLLDIWLPGRGGVELLKEIRAARPSLPVLVVSAHPESQFAARMLRAGASGYLNKECSPQTLVRAVRQVLAGGKYVSAALAKSLVNSRPLNTVTSPHELLSDREYDVMLRLASGQSVTQIAATLNLSVKTISTDRMRLLTKMNVAGNAELAQYALQAHLVE